MYRIYTVDNFPNADLNRSTCSICIDVFHNPYMLMCGHSFCQICLIAYRKTSNDCPTCRNSIDIEPVQNKGLELSDIFSLKYKCLTKECDYVDSVGYNYINVQHHRDHCEHIEQICFYAIIILNEKIGQHIDHSICNYV